MADTCSNFGRHRIELFTIVSDVERGIGVASDQKGAGLKAHGRVRTSHQVRQLVFQLSSTDFFENGRDAIGHFRLFDFSFLEERDGRWADIDEFPADGTDDSIVLIGEEANKCANLIFRDHSLRLSIGHSLTMAT